ncbi:MAG: TrkH family potassium uptake protein [Planctomycetota bacterium]
MRLSSLAPICGILLLLLAAAQVLPLVVAFAYDSPAEIPAFLWSIAASAGIGLLLLLVFRGSRRDLNTREGFAVVALGWALLSAFGALPFRLAEGGIDRYLDAFFETMSGFTTTGASILANPEGLPKGLLFWRSLTHWLGGMGIVVLTVAILPFLGAGGYQMLRAEVPGPTADKLEPRIAQTAKILWQVYLLLTVLEILLLLPSMGFFDASCHAFGTLATGGFSTRNLSIAHYQSVYVDSVITVFMLIAGASFVLHFRLLRGRGLPHLRDPEFRFYITLVIVAIAAISGFLYWGSHPEQEAHPQKYESLGQCLRYASFQVGAIVTTTGYVTADFDRWPIACRFILILLMVIGGCAGSTGGGVKCVRVLVLLRYGAREIRHIIRPHAVLPLKIGGQSVDREVIGRVMGFMALYLLLFSLAVLTMTVILDPGLEIGREAGGGAAAAPGYERENSALLTAFGSVLATIGNIGPGLGAVGPMENYAGIPDVGKGVLIICMLLGRLEIYSVLVVLSRLTWRR